MKNLWEKSSKGKRAYSLPKSFYQASPPQKHLRKQPVPLPALSELEIMRHFSHLAQRNVGIDTTFYPLGSCTMKYNPRVNEQVAQLSAFSELHPLAPTEQCQGALEVIYELIHFLAELCGMDGGSLAPNAGAQGEFLGLRLIQAYHASRNDPRDEVLVPESAHGTNPATAKMLGYRVKTLKTAPDGDVDLEDLKLKLGPKTAALMLTNPSTLGLFSTRIEEMSAWVHKAGGLLYYDGANLNPIMEIARPGEMGFDVMHINLHKTFSTPHGGGGPGAGPVLCKKHLLPFLPLPQVIKTKEGYGVKTSSEDSVGRLSHFYGNFLVALRAYTYIRLHGKYGLRRVSEAAILHANYLKHHLSKLFKEPYPQTCMHEFVLQADRFLDKKITALHLVKRLLDYGIHAPTVYFPLIVKEALLIEPTETESLESLDSLIDAFKKIVNEAEEDPEILLHAPHHQKVKRVDEVKAVKDLNVNALCSSTHAVLCHAT